MQKFFRLETVQTLIPEQKQSKYERNKNLSTLNKENNNANNNKIVKEKGTNTMINIKEMSREFNEVEQYLMTIAPSIVSMKDVEDGKHITVDGVLMFEDVKEDSGEAVEVMSIITPEKVVYSCQSATFKRSINDISNIMKGKPFTVIKTSGKTKANRDYINCVLDVDSLA